MEAATAAARKEWRAVPETSLRSNVGEDAEHGNVGQSDERTIYEEGAGGLDVDFCSITIDGSGGLSEEILQQRLQTVAQQREELQQMEIELRAQIAAHPQILDAQRSFEAAAKEHVAAGAKLKEQLQEREKYIIELELKLGEKDRELNALKIDNETAWANEDLLREQNKELATFRRERDNSEAERAQHLKQIRELQEHLREKESQFLALEEQHRIAQENILYKDEQLREAHSWVARVQEMDALQSQSLQAELRERTEQFNQFWMGFQQQYAEMQRNLLQTIQQLQIELAEARGRTGTQQDSSRAAHESSVESAYVQSKGNNLTVNVSKTADGNLVHNSNGSLDGSAKIEHGSAVPVVPSSLLGLGSFLPSGQMTGMHPYMMHPQGIPQPLTSPNSTVPQLGHLQPLSAIPPNQQWPNQQEAPDASKAPNHTNYQSPQVDQNALQAGGNYNQELSVQRQVIRPEHLISHGSQQQRSGNNFAESNHEMKDIESNGNEYLVPKEQQKAPKEQEDILTSSINTSTVKFEQEQKVESKDKNIASGSHSEMQVPGQEKKHSNVAVSTTQSLFKGSNTAAEFNSNVSKNDVNSVDTLRSAAGTSSSMLPGVPKEPALLDERSLLACIVRAIPAGPDGRIRISTTLPNRLGKMLAPLHWHDYKKHYGKLDDFVANHPELFVIEGDFIQLREGAQQIISATTAAAKIAAATASSAPYSSLLPSVAVTPVAQSIRQKRSSVVDSGSGNTMSLGNGSATTNYGDQYDKHSQVLKANDRQQSIGYNIIKGAANAAISNKLKGLQESNGFSAEIRPGQSTGHAAVANGGRHERAALPAYDKSVSNGRHGPGGKQQGRSTGAAYMSRR